VVSLDLPAIPSSATKARQLARGEVARYPADLSNTVALVVTELVTNAILHARTDFQVRIEIAPPLVRLTVTDGSARLPVVRHYAAEDVTGRGLGLVEALCTRWGIDAAEDGKEGKSVWCEVLIPDGDTADVSS
jgi:two-component sensor histidine kinase